MHAAWIDVALWDTVQRDQPRRRSALRRSAEDCLVELDARVWLLVGEGLEAIEKQPGRIDHIDGGSYLRFLAAGELGGRALEPCCLRDQGLGAPIEQLAGGRNRLTQSRPRGRSMVQTDAGETFIHPVDR